MKQLPLALILTLLGLIPFVAAALLPLIGMNHLQLTYSLWGAPFILSKPLFMIALDYATAIAIFLCGTHWAFHVKDGHKATLNLLLISNILFLVIWSLSYFPDGLLLSILSIPLIYIILFWIDWRLYRDEIINRSYLQIRAIATAGVLLFWTLMLVNTSLTLQDSQNLRLSHGWNSISLGEPTPHSPLPSNEAHKGTRNHPPLNPGNHIVGEGY
jgi:hypothetical protein